jgi:serine/threonine-protein phosphatase 2B catalytic subunit
MTEHFTFRNEVL